MLAAGAHYHVEMWLCVQVIAGICLAVWLINIPRFNDPLHGGWVRDHLAGMQFEMRHLLLLPL